MDQAQDEHIVNRVILGDLECFKLIVERYQKKVFGIGMRFFKNADDSSDFTQEVFFKAFNSLGSYKAKAPFRFWLTRIAYNHAINRAGALKTEPDVSGMPVASGEEGPEESQIKDEISSLLRNAMKGLPDRYRICLDFYFFMGLSHQEISEITGLPVNTIKSHVLRAKNILRDQLRGTIAEEYHEM